jgi:hypothetical protein
MKRGKEWLRWVTDFKSNEEQAEDGGRSVWVRGVCEWGVHGLGRENSGRGDRTEAGDERVAD